MDPSLPTTTNSSNNPGPGSAKSNALPMPMLQNCHAEPAVHVIEVPVDYSDNDRILNHDIKERSAKV